MLTQERKNEMFEKIKWLFENPNIFPKMGKNAYSKVHTIWSAENAVNNLLLLINSIENGKLLKISGPCEKA